MQALPRLMLNTPSIELWPAPALRARSNADARALARATWVLRRKRDGRYLAALLPEGLLPLVPRLAREAGLDDALDAADSFAARHRRSLPDPVPLPLAGLQRRLRRIGVDDGHAARTGLPLEPEPSVLAWAGRDRYRRALWLTAGSARAWRAMRRAAAADGVVLEAISGYRSHDYQLGIFERKFARGQVLAQILAVNAAPGYSEHHSGQALDIGTPGEPPAEASFERSAAFAWLAAHAARFGFAMSYPRDNPHGIVYEPWHWRFRGEGC
ncbi:D-alanyl-D-alanine carboxypeptidase family protein [Stenotrophomonas sp. MMGLT7]|uniref:D-alanyl-D-alanine carboxypeptidase family protein n=1 Tax=Stenotrophomonas sp. MMGLT7 TaxID=2901227 RepID=UPI001E39A329|nr:D-alanyl-D-alanine carboxypeptidase family protein [Stenotrophomonas sp. MMGLT7]MCD7100354.1 D-alanyl-D-alanine carboxypeptidase family protein [Stenotrophomonas sp. MMGLT7]